MATSRPNWGSRPSWPTANGYISPVLVLFTLCVNTVVCAVLLRPGRTVYTLMLSHSAGTLRSDCTKNSYLRVTLTGVKLGGWGIPPNLRSDTSCLRSTTSNNRSCTWQLRSGTFLLGSTTLHSLYLSIFLYACFVKNVVLPGHFVICICPCLVWIDVAIVKHYLNAIKAKQNALNAREPLVGGREPHLCSPPFRQTGLLK